MTCKICQTETSALFTAQVLGKYQVEYYQCAHCKFIQTEQPYWLPESYQEAITDLDIGYVTRNISIAEMVISVIKLSGIRSSRFIDYGGGYGLFVRLLRDKGYDFYRQDIHCKNLFANNFDVTDLPDNERFSMLTAFEVFEHLEFPIAEIEKMLAYADTLFFSTVLQPSMQFMSPDDWWYFAPSTGQHIAFYSQETLHYIARRFQCHLYSDNSGLHMLTKKKMPFNTVKIVSRAYWLVNKLFSRHFNYTRGLLASDSILVTQALQRKQTQPDTQTVSYTEGHIHHSLAGD